MDAESTVEQAPSREQLLHSLYEAAELEHNLMCTYLYAAFSLKGDDSDGLPADELAAVRRWRRAVLEVAIAEMGHLVAIWNITAGLGGTPRFGRANFPLDPGLLPAGVVVKLAPFTRATLQHFVHLERPTGSAEADGDGFAPERRYTRASRAPRLTPMARDYETVGEFYATLDRGLSAFVAARGEDEAFSGDPSLQLDRNDVALDASRPVRCLKTARAALDAIVQEGEGAPLDSTGSHFQRFLEVRAELESFAQQRPGFAPAFPAATNPVLRPPPRPEGRIWIEDPTAAAVVDVGNATYGLMLRLLASAYTVPRGSDARASTIDLAMGLMRAMTALGEAAARLPAGPSHPECHAGLSFTTLRDAAPLPHGAGMQRFVIERCRELAAGAAALPSDGAVPTGVATRIDAARRQLHALAERAARALWTIPEPRGSVRAGTSVERAADRVVSAPASAVADGVETVEGQALTLSFEAKRCIHARFCVTGAPRVFLANVQGPWIHPDAMPVERVVEIAHACPSGAIRYRRRDGGAEEPLPPVNLASIRESGPYAFRGDLRLDGETIGTRATLCRCGASRNKPYCDGSHHDAGFTATGEPASSGTDMLEVRDGPLRIDAEPDGPLHVRGSLEITSGTGRVVARLTSTRLCRCGGSAAKPYCDGTHARIGFRT